MARTSNNEHWDDGVEPAYQDISNNTTADLPGTAITAQTQAGSVRGKEVHIDMPTQTECE